MQLELGRKIVMLRREQGLSQSELALTINLSRATLSHYERGCREIRTDTLLKIAAYFDVSVEYLIGRTNCRLSVRAYNDVFTMKDGQLIRNSALYEMLSKVPQENREVLCSMVTSLAMRD